MYLGPCARHEVLEVKMSYDDHKTWHDRSVVVLDELRRGILAGMQTDACDPQVMDDRMAECLADLKRSAFEIGRKRGQKIFVPRLPRLPRVVAEYPLRKQFKTTEEALKAGHYPNGHDQYISDETYPLRHGMQTEVDLVGLDVSPCFVHQPSTAELCALFSEHGFERPVYEDGLRHCAEYPDEPYARLYVYLHEPDAGGLVLVRGHWGGKKLSRFFGDPGIFWDRKRCVFFVRRKSAPKAA